jgi:YesN/AraC family two-component response regulator
MKNDRAISLTKNLSLLYVEDEADTRKIVKELLDSMFFKVSEAVDGEEAFEHFEKGRFDMVITDLKMPKKDGLSLIKDIREIDSDIPIIIFSAHSDVNFFLEAIALDIDGYILKPVREKNLIQTIYKSARNLQARRQIEAARKKEIEGKELIINYQKTKINNYKSLLEELLLIKHIKKSKDSSEYNRSDALLSQEERELLRKRRSDVKTTASEYVADIEADVLEDIYLLEEIERDMSESLASFGESPNEATLKEVTSYLKEYTKNIRLLIEFEDLACALESLLSFLDTLPSSESEENSSKISIYLQNIFDDLKEWRYKIFITQDTHDIHYLDSSLFSSTLQLQLDLSNTKDDGNDIELF